MNLHDKVIYITELWNTGEGKEIYCLVHFVVVLHERWCSILQISGHISSGESSSHEELSSKVLLMIKLYNTWG